MRFLLISLFFIISVFKDTNLSVLIAVGIAALRINEVIKVSATKRPFSGFNDGDLEQVWSEESVINNVPWYFPCFLYDFKPQTHYDIFHQQNESKVNGVT